MMNFVAIDFETANQYRNSACSVAVVEVKNGEITYKPIPKYVLNKFQKENIPPFRWGCDE